MGEKLTRHTTPLDTYEHAGNPVPLIEVELGGLVSIAEDHAIACGGNDYYLGKNDGAKDSFLYREAGIKAYTLIDFQAERNRATPISEAEYTMYYVNSEFGDTVHFSNIPKEMLDATHAELKLTNEDKNNENLDCWRIITVKNTFSNVDGYNYFNSESKVYFKIEDRYRLINGLENTESDDVTSNEYDPVEDETIELSEDMKNIEEIVENFEQLRLINEIRHAQSLLKIVINRTFDGR